MERRRRRVDDARGEELEGVDGLVDGLRGLGLTRLEEELDVGRRGGCCELAVLLAFSDGGV